MHLHFRCFVPMCNPNSTLGETGWQPNLSSSCLPLLSYYIPPHFKLKKVKKKIFSMSFAALLPMWEKKGQTLIILWYTIALTAPYYETNQCSRHTKSPSLYFLFILPPTFSQYVRSKADLRAVNQMAHTCWSLSRVESSTHGPSDLFSHFVYRCHEHNQKDHKKAGGNEEKNLSSS